METRTLERTGRDISVVGMGCWQIGGSWGEVSETDALDTLLASADAGVTEAMRDMRQIKRTVVLF